MKDQNSETATTLNRIDRKLNSLSSIEDNLERIVAKEDQEIKKIEKEEERIEANLLKLGNFTVKRSHVLELARGTAGAFLGVGLGASLGLSLKLASSLPWKNIIGILIFVFLLVGLLIYKNDKNYIKNSDGSVVTYISKKIMVLYAIALSVELVCLFLFNEFPGWNAELVKALFVGSVPAMSAAAAFSII